MHQKPTEDSKYNRSDQLESGKLIDRISKTDKLESYLNKDNDDDNIEEEEYEEYKNNTIDIFEKILLVRD